MGLKFVRQPTASSTFHPTPHFIFLMYSIARLDERLSPMRALANTVEKAELDSVFDSSEAVTTSNLKPESATEALEEGPQKTIMIISISYATSLDEEGNASLTLRSVRNDLKLQLDRHKYEYNGTKEKFLIFTDYEPEYTDLNGVRAIVPHSQATKKDILDGFAKATSRGGTVVIYYSGHCVCGELTVQADGRWRYKENGVERAAVPYIIPSDLERISGEEVWAALGGRQTTEGNMTIKLIFDTCHAATFFDKAVRFPCLYRAPAIEGSKASLPKTQPGQTQIIFLAATQLPEEAGTFRLPHDPEEQVGAVTSLMTEFFEDREGPRSAQGLVERLYGVCRGRQTPQIQSLVAIEGDFEL